MNRYPRAVVCAGFLGLLVVGLIVRLSTANLCCESMEGLAIFSGSMVAFLVVTAIYLVASWALKAVLRPERPVWLHVVSVGMALLLPLAYLAVSITLHERAFQHELNVADADRRQLRRLPDAVEAGSLTQAEQALANGADVNQSVLGVEHSGKETRPLHLAVGKGDVRMTAFLLDHGADLNAQNNAGMTPIFMAVEEGSYETFQLLLLRHPDVSIRSEWHGSILVQAVLAKDPRFLQDLLARKLPRSVLDDPQGPALEAAAFLDDAGPVRLLLAAGASPDFRAPHHDPAICTAAQGGHLAPLRALLEAGADPNAPCSSGGESRNALELAEQNREAAVVAVLRRFSAKHH